MVCLMTHYTSKYAESLCATNEMVKAPDFKIELPGKTPQNKVMQSLTILYSSWNIIQMDAR